MLTFYKENCASFFLPFHPQIPEKSHKFCNPRVLGLEKDLPESWALGRRGVGSTAKSVKVKRLSRWLNSKENTHTTLNCNCNGWCSMFIDFSNLHCWGNISTLGYRFALGVKFRHSLCFGNDFAIFLSEYIENINKSSDYGNINQSQAT